MPACRTSAANGRRAAVPNIRPGADMGRRLDARAPDFERAFAALLSENRETDEDVAAAVRTIIADVRQRGDAALIELTQRFDKAAISAETMRVPSAEIEAAQ